MFIDDIKNLFSGSDTIVIVFSDEKLVWCNRNAEFFGGKFPMYDEFEIKGMKNSENNDTMLFDAEMKNESISLNGELRKSGNFSVFMLRKKDIFKEAFEDSLFQKYIESNNLYIKATINEISAYVTLMRSEAEKNNIRNFTEYYDGIDSSCMGIMKTVQNNEIMKSSLKDYSNTNSFVNINNMIDEICLSVTSSCKNKIKIKNHIGDTKMYSSCDENYLKLFFIHVLRYVIFSSYSTEISINLSEKSNDYAEITMLCSKKEKTSNLTMDFYDKMINFNMDELLITRLSESLDIPVSKKEFDKKISVVMKFRLCEPNGFKAPKKPDRHTKFSPVNITFFDFTS